MDDNNLFNPSNTASEKKKRISSLSQQHTISQNKHQQCNVVCRDITKSFDKIWEPGLQYRILNMKSAKKKYHAPL